MSLLGGQVYFAEDFRKQVLETVKAAESQTSAEVVVAVQPNSGDYQQADLVAGCALAFVALCVFLYHPAPFDYRFFAFEFLLIFGLGAGLSAGIPALRRALTSKKTLARAVEGAAAAAFLRLGIHRTRERSGILVFISTFERKAVVLCDSGIPMAEIGDDYARFVARIEAAARHDRPNDVLAAIRDLGPALATFLPRSASDVNELPDEAVEVAS